MNDSKSDAKFEIGKTKKKSKLRDLRDLSDSSFNEENSAVSDKKDCEAERTKKRAKKQQRACSNSCYTEEEDDENVFKLEDLNLQNKNMKKVNKGNENKREKLRKDARSYKNDVIKKQLYKFIFLFVCF